MSRPNILNDRIMVVSGGVMTFVQDVLRLPSAIQPANVLLTTAPAEVKRLQDAGQPVPRDKTLRVDMEVMIGTVDEIVDRFRTNIVKAFNLMTLSVDEHGRPRAEQPIIPVTGTTDLEPCNAVLRRNGIDKFTLLERIVQ